MTTLTPFPANKSALVYVALTASNFRLQQEGQPPIVRNVRVRMQEHNGVISIFVRRDPTSRYSFHKKDNTSEWHLAMPRAEFSFIEKNWGKTKVFGEWSTDAGGDLLTITLNLDDLTKVKGGDKKTQASVSEKATALTARDKLNRLVEKELITLQVEDGKLSVIFAE